MGVINANVTRIVLTNFDIMEIKDNTFSRQFETHFEGKLLTIEYSLQERKLFLTKIVEPENYTDETVVNEFLKEILVAMADENEA